MQFFINQNLNLPFYFLFSAFYFSDFFFLPSCGLLEYFLEYHFDLSVMVLSVYLCIDFQGFLQVFIYLYIKITYHTLVMDFFTISSEVETLPPFIFIYFPHRLKRGRKVYWISSYFCLLCSFFLIFQESFFYYFLSVWTSSSSYSFRVGVMVTNSLKFSSSENVSISLSFLMDIFEGCRILGQQSFSFSA